MARAWTPSGAAYEIDWGGRPWTLRVDAEIPGLHDARSGPLLALEGLAEANRRDVGALGGRSLASHELRFDRVEATYKPEGWGEIAVRASWFPIEDDGLGLEVELSARSVDSLHKVEVLVLSALETPPPAGSHRSASPRDRDAAALSYDGREGDLAALVTGPPGDPLGPWMASRTHLADRAYVEMVRPEDASRRISEGRLPFSSTRYGLFGYDLERGVVLRGRLRGYWWPKASAYSSAEAAYRGFLDEPPPLRT